MSSPLALPFLIVLLSLLALASLFASASLLQGSQLKTLVIHMRGERVRRRVTSREGRAGGFEEVAKQCHEGDE